MEIGERLKQARLEHFQKLKRPAIAQALSAYTGTHITDSVIRDIETGKSSRWLPAYIDWAKMHLGFALSDSEQLLQIESRSGRLSASEEVEKVLDLKIWEGRPLDRGNGIEPVFTESNRYYRCPLILLDASSCIALQVFGWNIGGIAPDGSFLIVRRSKSARHGSLVIIQEKNELTLATLEITPEEFKLSFFHASLEAIIRKEFDEINIFGYVISIVKPYESDLATEPNIVWNGGEAIRPRR